MPGTPTLLLDGLVFPEGPRWHDGSFWVSDMHAHDVIRIELDGTPLRVCEVPGQPSGLGWLPDGRMLVVSMVDRTVLRLDPDGLVEHADLRDFAPALCNDMVVDRLGRAYVGNFGFDAFGGEEPKPTRLALVEPDGRARVVADEMLFPNGSVITPDGGTLIVAETMGRRLTAFDVADDGSLQHRRVWAQLEVPPDGICLDAEGCVWVAVPMHPGGGFLRVAEGGDVRERIDIEDRGGYACMLGGPDRRTLLMLEAFEANPAGISRGNGRLRTAEVDVPGAGWP